jgi:hypothetical protein
MAKNEGYDWGIDMAEMEWKRNEAVESDDEKGPGEV